MKKSFNVCAYDVGGSGGKTFIGAFDGERVSLTEAHRYPFGMMRVGEAQYWDIPYIIHNALTGLESAAFLAEGNLAAFGATGFGNVFTMLDDNGRLFGHSFAASHWRMRGVLDDLLQNISREMLYQRTGLEINENMMLMMLHAYQVHGDAYLLREAAYVMQHVDALKYFMTGKRYSERTAASVSGLYAPSLGNWDPMLAELVRLPLAKLPPVADPCTRAGQALPFVRELTGLSGLEVIHAPQHDTAAAAYAVPTSEKSFAFLILGTFAVCGVETDKAVINEDSLREHLGNEANPFEKNKLLRAARAMWFLEQCLLSARRHGQAMTYEEAIHLAAQEMPMRFFIDLDNRSYFNETDDMPASIAAYCRETGQGEVQRLSQALRCVFDSIAWFAHRSYEKLWRVSKQSVHGIYAVNGGARNSLLLQMVADLTGLPVYAGVFHASIMGVVLSALVAMGELSSLSECRQVSVNSTTLRVYAPKVVHDLRWAERYERNRL